MSDSTDILGIDAWAEINKMISDSVSQGKVPIKVLIPAVYKNAIALSSKELFGNTLHEKIINEGIDKTIPEVEGIEADWNAKKLALEF